MFPQFEVSKVKRIYSNHQELCTSSHSVYISADIAVGFHATILNIFLISFYWGGEKLCFVMFCTEQSADDCISLHLIIFE